MTRTTVTIPDEVRRRLGLMAAERGVSLATVIREALEEKSSCYQPKPRNLGIGDSGRSDISYRIGEERAKPR